MRYENRRKRKRKIWRNFFLILLLLIGGATYYSYAQYKQGISQSLEKQEKDTLDEEVYEFNVEEDQTGGKMRNDGANILILGSDSRGEKAARADTIMIARYAPDASSYKLVSIMRDMYVSIPGYGKNRINTAFALGGPELLRKTIKENFDIDIQYFALIDFEGFVQVIDEAFPKGVEIEVEKKMSTNIDVVIESGLQRLDGEHLLGYVRFRHDAVGDFGRVERQQKAVKEIAKQFASFQTIPKLPKLLGVVTPYIQTNMDTTDILYIGKDFLTKSNKQIESLRLPIDGAWTNATINGAEVLQIDLEKNKMAIHEFFAK